MIHQFFKTNNELLNSGWFPKLWQCLTLTGCSTSSSLLSDNSCALCPLRPFWFPPPTFTGLFSLPPSALLSWLFCLLCTLTILTVEVSVFLLLQAVISVTVSVVFTGAVVPQLATCWASLSSNILQILSPNKIDRENTCITSVLHLHINPFGLKTPRRVTGNSADPDQMQQNVTSYQGLHGLH